MIIIFEGVDGSGKSTLAAATAAALVSQGRSVRETHHGPLTREPLEEYVLDYQDYRPGSGIDLVIDRHAWGERVYGPIYREESRLTRAQFRWVELWLLSRGGSVWHVTQPLNTIQRRLAARGEDFLRSEHVRQVIDGFAAVASEAVTAAGDLSPEGDVSELVNKVLMHAQYQESRAGTLAAEYPSFVGDPLPRVLLVGDKRGGTPPHPTESAFLPVGGNSGAFLLDALDDDFWPHVAMVNGTEEGDRLTQLVDDLYGPPVVALGREASNALLDLDIEHAGVPHPAYIRRFHNKRKEQYGMLIRDVTRTGEARFSWPS